MERHISLFETATPAERAPYVEAFARAGLVASLTRVGGASIVVTRDADAIVVTRGSDAPLRLSAAIAPDDLAAFVQLVSDLETVRFQLRAAGDAESARLLSSMIAHDANNVLSAMVVAADELLELGRAQVADLAQEILDGCHRLAAMLRRILAVQRPAGPQKVNVNALLANLAPTLRTLVGRDVVLTTRLESPLPQVRIDPMDLERVVLNLVTNARDAMPNGGRIVVMTSVVLVAPNDSEGAPAGRWVAVDVEDGGVGMDEATAARAFTPFFTTKSAGRGTGLGLASVLHAARAAGGHARIESTTKDGTRLRVYLPFSPRESAAP
jgi:two-component system cell cycle sensor histidine kinase/response regulator CckA